MKTIIILFLLVSQISIYAQDDYQKWSKKEHKKYQQFLKEDDKKFAEFLKKDWRNFQLFTGVKRDETPKPVTKPVLRNPIGGKRIPIKSKVHNIKVSPKPKIVPTKNSEPIEKPVGEFLNINMNIYSESTDLEIFGINNRFLYPIDFPAKTGSKISKETIAGFWTTTASKPYKSMLKEFRYDKKNMHLNDWGYLELLKKASEIFYPDNENNQNLFIWFFMIKSGYKVRVAIISGKVYVFIPSDQNIYDLDFFRATDNEPRYYILSFNNKPVHISGYLSTYKGEYPGATKLIDMRIKTPLKASKKMFEKSVSFNYKGKKYNLKFEVPESTIEFYKNYPYSDLSVYFNAPVSEVTKNAILSKLKDYIKNLNEVDAANFLLTFSQFAFKYKTDQAQFGREKPFFVEETIYYPYSDCEDRAVFYSFLVKNLLHLDVVGVDYPGHVATAVKFNEDVKGDYISYKGEKYTVCDPTYYGASIGMAQPEYKHGPIENIIEVK